MLSLRKENSAMLATLSRIFLAPIIFLIFHSSLDNKLALAAALFYLAALTDWLDGYLARLFQAESHLGRLLDPVADKILVLSALLTLSFPGPVPTSMVFLLIARDIFIGGIRSAAAAESLIISAAPLGKVKTALQMIVLPILFFHSHLSTQHVNWLIGVLWGSVALSLLSGYQYINSYLKKKS